MVLEPETLQQIMNSVLKLLYEQGVVTQLQA